VQDAKVFNKNTLNEHRSNTKFAVNTIEIEGFIKTPKSRIILERKVRRFKTRLGE